MYNILDRQGRVLASVGAYVTALNVVTYYSRHGIVANIQGAVK